MIVDERMVTYINSLDTGSGQFLDQLCRLFAGRCKVS